jgi:nucleotide-binding universal stress UspA family protein
VSTNETDRETEDEGERVLIPLRVLKGETFGSGLARLFAPVEVVVLGYHVVPDQTPPDQMRQQFEAQANKSLDRTVETVREAGGSASRRLVFSRDPEETIDRVAEEIDATALVEVNPVSEVESLLVPLRGDMDAARITEFVAALRGDREMDVTLFAAARSENREAAEALVASAEEHLRELGIPADAIRTEYRTTVTPVQAIVDAAVEHDAVVLGEREPDWRSLIFGELSEQIADESLGPVVVVRHRRPVGEEGDDPDKEAGNDPDRGTDHDVEEATDPGEEPRARATDRR